MRERSIATIAICTASANRYKLPASDLVCRYYLLKPEDQHFAVVIHCIHFFFIFNKPSNTNNKSGNTIVCELLYNCWKL